MCLLRIKGKHYMYKPLFIVALFVLSAYRPAENPSMQYIALYKDIAVNEMHRTGIPASIKMAQALLESGAGQSVLAKSANNHFGIKCGGQWDGETYYREDDDYKNGKLVKSCFRKFDSAYKSFLAHSDFLVSQKRYAFLFDIHHSDYSGWAHGLKKAGYATDRKYPQKLIDIIEKYELYKLDQNQDLAVNEVNKSNTDKTTSVTRRPSDRTTKNQRKRSKPKAQIKSKRNKRNKNSDYHIVGEDQSIAEIASLYNCDENALRMRNRLPKDAQPLAGEKVYLKKKISLLRRPKFVRVPKNTSIASSDLFMF